MDRKLVPPSSLTTLQLKLRLLAYLPILSRSSSTISYIRLLPLRLCSAAMVQINDRFYRRSTLLPRNRDMRMEDHLRLPLLTPQESQ